MQRGQISLYLIIGFVVLISIIGVFYLKGTILKQTTESRSSEVASIPEQLKNDKEQIKTCIDDSILNDIYSIAFTGGLFGVKDGALFSGVNIPFLLIDKKNLLPTKEQIAINLAKLIESNIKDYCGNYEFAEFGEPTVNVKLENQIVVDISWPIKLQKGTISGEIESFSFDYDTELLKMRDIANNLINNQIKYYPDVCTSCLASIAVDNNTIVERSIQEGSQIILVRSNNDPNLAYGYAVKYE